MRIVRGVGLCVCAACLACAALVPAQPPASKKEMRAHGAEVFHSSGCEHCHGADGHGTERGPSLARCGKRLHEDGIAKQIRDGGKQMPPFGEALSGDDIQALVEFAKHVK